jgi:hypothetical protein
VDAIAADVQEVTANASALSTTVSAAFGGPLVKVAAFGYGVRRALGRTKDDRGTVVVGVGKTVGSTVGNRLPAARRGRFGAGRRKG